jgi:hypothetical protein
VRVVVLALVSASSIAGTAGCSGDAPAAAPAPPAATNKTAVVGVFPDQFTCDSVAPPDEVARALGGAARPIDGQTSAGAEVPRPCNYVVDAATGPEAWTFDLDCRPNYEKTAAKLFDQYAAQSQEAVDDYNGALDAGHLLQVDAGKPVELEPGQKPADAAPPIKAPEAAHTVQVGKKALDHHGQGLLFLDDDAPCYVRVMGPDAARRLALAQVIAKYLTPARAPMTPHVAP